MATGTLSTIERAVERKEQAERLKLGARVHEMRLAGKSYLQIAKEMDMAPARSAELHREHVDVLRQLETLGAMDAYRSVQDQRYEALLSTLWDDAMNGDMDAVRECRRILDSITAREAKVTMLVSRNEDGAKTTLIAEGSTADYIEALRRMGQ